MKLVRKHFVSRIIILIVIITMVVEGVPTSWNFGFGSLKAEAKTIGVVQMGSLFAGAEIGDGQIYTVTGNQTISASEVSQNGLIVKANSTATIYIPKGSTLTVNGYRASQ